MTRYDVYTLLIDAERQRQDEEWGGRRTDEMRTPRDWLLYITKQIKLCHTQDILPEHPGNPPELLDARREMVRMRFVKIAALAVAALETFP